MGQRSPKIEPADPIGLCARCRFSRVVRTPRALYRLCEKAATDPAYEKYPRLPMRLCPGYRPRED